MKTIRLVMIAVLMSMAIDLSTSYADEAKTAREIFTRFKNRYHGEDNIMEMRLLLINKRGEQRKIDLLRYRQRKDALVNTVFFFVRPHDVRGTATLTVERPKKEDLQRIYLHSLKRHRRIASSDKGKSWLGTDMRYEDIQEKKPDDFNYSSLTTVYLDGKECFYFNMTPKTRDKSSYGRLEYWIQKNNDEMIQGRYYDKRNRCIKVMKMGHFVKTLDSKGKRTINSQTWMTMYNLKDKHRTILITDRVIYNVGLPDKTFSPRFIESLPKTFKGGHAHETRMKDCMFDPAIVKSPGPTTQNSVRKNTVSQRRR